MPAASHPSSPNSVNGVSMVGPSHRSDMYSHFSTWLTVPALLVVSVHRIGADSGIPHRHSLDADLGRCPRCLLERHVDAVRLRHVNSLAPTARVGFPPLHPPPVSFPLGPATTR